MRNVSLIAPLAALVISAPLAAQEEAKTEFPSPNAIVDAAPSSDWRAIAADDLLVMDLVPDAAGQERRVIIQLMPAPFSQGWIRNIRKLATAKFWDGTSVNRVQDNYVVQWGDAGHDNPESGEVERKALPADLEVVPESEYVVDVDTLAEFTEADPERAEKFGLLLQELDKFEAETAKGVLEAEAFLKELEKLEMDAFNSPTAQENVALLTIQSTQTELTSQGWHERDGYASWVEFWKGWPIANFEKGKWKNENGEVVPRPSNTQRHELAKKNIFREVEQSDFWPVHCYGMVGVGRGMSPDTGTGAELYTVIGHAPRHLDRNIAVVGRIVEGMEHLSSLPRGKGVLGFYADASKRVPIRSIRLASALPEAEQPRFEYLNTDSEPFARYADARANRRDPFFIKPAGGADICNIPVPVRRVKAE